MPGRNARPDRGARLWPPGDLNMRVSGIRPLIGIFAALPMTVMAGGGSVDRKVSAESNGEVVISNVSGTVDVRGWDRNEVQVTGHLDDDVERLDVESGSGRTVIKVVVPRGGSNDSDATLEVHVPRMSTV